MPLLLSPLLLFLSRSEIPAPSAPLSQPPSTFLPPPLASALSFAFRPPFYSRRRSSLLPLNLRRHLLSLLHSHPCRHFSLLPSCFFPTAAPVSAAAAAVVATEPRPDPGYTVVNAVMEKEDGLGCRCVHTLTVVPVVGEEGSPDYIGPQLILFGGATTLEGNSATPPSSAGSAGIRLVGVTADVHYYDVLSILLQECTLFDIFD